MKQLNLIVTNREFRDGQGFTEYDVQRKINDFLMDTIRSELVGRDFNFVITVETQQHYELPARIYTATVID